MKVETIEKVKNIATDYFNPEKSNASRILAKKGVYIDIAGIEWKREKLETFTEKKLLFLFGFNPLNI